MVSGLTMGVVMFVGLALTAPLLRERSGVATVLVGCLIGLLAALAAGIVERRR